MSDALYAQVTLQPRNKIGVHFVLGIRRPTNFTYETGEFIELP